MQRRPLLWLVISLLSLAGAIYFWQLGNKQLAQRRAAQGANTGAIQPVPASSKSPLQLPSQPASKKQSPKTPETAKNRFPYRLSNTSKTIGQLLGNDKAILLANALIDTANPVKPAIPERLRAAANSGSY